MLTCFPYTRAFAFLLDFLTVFFTGGCAFTTKPRNVLSGLWAVDERKHITKRKLKKIQHLVGWPYRNDRHSFGKIAQFDLTSVVALALSPALHSILYVREVCQVLEYKTLQLNHCASKTANSTGKMLIWAENFRAWKETEFKSGPLES